MNELSKRYRDERAAASRTWRHLWRQGKFHEISFAIYSQTATLHAVSFSIHFGTIQSIFIDLGGGRDTHVSTIGSPLTTMWRWSCTNYFDLFICWSHHLNFVVIQMSGIHSLHDEIICIFCHLAIESFDAATKIIFVKNNSSWIDWCYLFKFNVRLRPTKWMEMNHAASNRR